MMHTWFECKIRYDKVMENGMNKKVTEPYLVDALSFTEAEARIIEEITPFISGEFTVSDIKRANYSELFEDATGDRWFKCKLQFITLDEKSGAEKKISTYVLVQAGDLREAIKNLDEGMKGTMADYVIASVTETAIMDVYPYASEGEQKEGVVTVEFEGYSKEIESSILEQKSFEIDFNGEIKVKFEKRDIGIIAVNAIDSEGISQKESTFGRLLKYKKN